MNDELQGFRQFFAEGELAPASLESGKSELSRLERGHYFFALQVDHKLAWAFMNGHLTENSFARATPISAENIQQWIDRLTHDRDSALVVAVPKRWEKQLGRGHNIQELFGKMIGMSGKSGRYVWGAYSLWNPRQEDIDGGHFFRNPTYHADDSLLEGWLKDNPSPVKVTPTVPLNRQPRVMGHSLLDQGRHSFHGYTEPQLP